MNAVAELMGLAKGNSFERARDSGSTRVPV